MAGASSLSVERVAAYGTVLDLLAQKLREDEAAIGVEFPYVTAPDGRWLTMPASRSAGYSGADWSHGNWFCGFWIGLLLAAHLHSGDETLLAAARERMVLVAPRAEDGNTHDIGFIFLSSAIPLFHVTGDARYADTAVRAADKLRARLITTASGAYVSSWGPLDDVRGRSSSAIDTMANLRLLYWAADRCDDGSFRLAGEAHAAKTWECMVRDDRSTYHAVEYDLASGERRRGYTFQGFADESCWPRGQSWAILGMAETAKATGKPAYLDRAIELAEYYVRRTGASSVPPWDFDDPGESRAVLDSSAAAIAASRFLTISRVAREESVSRRWRDAALDVLDGLCRDYVAYEPSHRGLLKHAVYSMPHNIGTDSATLFGDYYFVECLAHLTMEGAFQPA